jgi:hypothetical protein
MNRFLLTAALLAALLFSVPEGVTAPPQDKREAAKEAKHEGHHFHHCAHECARCMLECESCARHCADMLRRGDSKHEKTLGTCADCGDICGVAAKSVARRGPMATTICEACATVCDRCASACEEFPTDEHMKKCGKACRDCGKACREMIKHGGEHEGSKRARSEK